MSKLDLIEQMIQHLEANGISPAQRFEINLSTVGLTSRDKEIVRLVRFGKAYKDIADELYISERTVSKHIQNVYEKLGVSNRVELSTGCKFGKMANELIKAAIRVFAYTTFAFLRRL